MEKKLKRKLWIALTISLLTCSGCKTDSPWNDVPLTDGDTPFILAEGTEIVDNEGIQHKLNGKYWVVPESDLYDAIMYIKMKNTHEINTLGAKNEEVIHVSN